MADGFCLRFNTTQTTLCVPRCYWRLKIPNNYVKDKCNREIFFIHVVDFEMLNFYMNFYWFFEKRKIWGILSKLIFMSGNRFCLRYGINFSGKTFDRFRPIRCNDTIFHLHWWSILFERLQTDTWFWCLVTYGYKRILFAETIF